MRLANGYRECSESDIAVVYRIGVMLAVGVPIAAIARLLDCSHDDGERLVRQPARDDL